MGQVRGVRFPGVLMRGLSVVLFGALFHDFILSADDPGTLTVCVASMLVYALLILGWTKLAAILSFLDERFLEEYMRSMERGVAGHPFPPLPPIQGSADEMPPPRPMDHPLWDPSVDG